MEQILFANPKAQYLAIKEQIDAALIGACERGWYILGKSVEQFEIEFASYLGAKHCVGVANGTDALALALRAVGVGPGSEVVTVSHSAVATVAAIEFIGATAVLVDIEPTTRCMDPAKLERAITTKTKALVPVHIYGQPANILAIKAIANAHKVALVEDCAQAHGAKVNGQMVGTFGDIAAFSFYPTKNLGALGDGGAVVSNNSALADQVRLLRQYGWRERYTSEITGWNSRLDEIQAAILQVKLRHLEGWNARRRQIAQQYDQVLANSKISAPARISGTEHAMHLYVVELDSRTDLELHLKHDQIAAGIHYPLAIHQQPAYLGRLRGHAELPNTEQLYKRILSLPMYPELTPEQVDHVCASLQRFLEA